MEGSEDTQTVEIRPDIVSNIEDRLEYTEFTDTEDYISYVLEEYLFNIGNEEDISNKEKVDEQQVEDRLKSLGYLNE